ncbi:hypothetical protein Lal_00003944 [Lupinus albus]|nr:hypothetical protein Lal_00003944 [Lupinus albus]
MVATDAPPLHIAIYPWFAMEHLTPYLHFSNKLGKCWVLTHKLNMSHSYRTLWKVMAHFNRKRCHKSPFFISKRLETKLQHLNLHPHLITLVPSTIPHVHGLPRHE